MRVTITAGLAADATRRTLTGTVYRYGEVGLTSAGPLAVGPSMPPPPIDLVLTEEHDRDVIRGRIALVDNNDERLRVAVRVVDGELGDRALAEASDRTRAAFSLDIEDAVVEDGVIVSGRWEALGQVGDPAFNSARIDQIAASNTPEGNTMLTEQQRARLAELQARTDLNAAETAEMNALLVLSGEQPETPGAQPASEAPAEQPAAVAASMPAVPAGMPGPRTQVRESQGSALTRMYRDLTRALETRSVSGVTAALSDITSLDHTANIEAPAWSGELFSGQVYQPEWTDLFTSGTLTNWSGRGWRFTTQLEIQDYAGNKAAIPSDTVTTEDSEYEAARMAVGVDIDRKFFDFPNEGFVQSLVEQVRESWAIQLDNKIRAFAVANAHTATKSVTVSTTNADATVTAAAGTFKASDVGASISGTGIPAGATIASFTSSSSVELSANATATGSTTATLEVHEPTILKAAARSVLDLKRRRVGRADWVVLNDEDMFTLLDINEDQVPVFLDLYSIDPRNFRSSPDVARGTVMAGVRQTATVRTLPGSPIRVNAQHLANGGIDEAFFGYWAIEEHHKSGIATVTFNAA